MVGGSYTFGDSALAAARLALVADVFADTTASFLDVFRAHSLRLVVDLGCGPGFTTALLRDVLAPDRVVAVDSSQTFVREAAERLGASAAVIVGDVMDLPDSVADADLIFARFLLTHLAEPAAAIDGWAARLAPRGLVAVEEVESITTDEPVLAAYLDLQQRMLRANHNVLEVGALVEEAAQQRGGVFHSERVALTPATPTVARMFAMNFETWRRRPVVLQSASPVELDEIAVGLTDIANSEASSALITWQLRQLSLTDAEDPPQAVADDEAEPPRSA
jgi:SAM-dependent methyltransferase